MNTPRNALVQSIEGTLNVKEITNLFELKRTDEEAYDDALEEVEDYFTVMSLMEDTSEEDFLKIVNGGQGFVWAEEIWFGLAGTITKAKMAFAEEAH